MYSSLLKQFILLVSLILCSQLFSQDTVTIQTLTWDSNGRSYWYNFPDIPLDQIEKINMIYNMRCHNAAIGNANGIGCFEWDYSCNTFITDTFRLDSIQTLHRKYDIPGSTSNEYYYSNFPTFNCISINQKSEKYSSITNEKNYVIGSPNSTIKIGPSEGRIFLLYKASDLKAASLATGNIIGFNLKNVSEQIDVPNLKIKIKPVSYTQLIGSNLNTNGMKEVYLKNTRFPANATQKLIFYNPYNWDGNSNLLVELSYNTIKNNKSLTLESQMLSSESIGIINGSVSLYKAGGEGYPLENTKLKNIQKEITVALWVKGDTSTLPANTIVFEGVDDKNQRQANVHLPWGNGSIYWDCGNDGTGYDRIEKPAFTAEIKGQWTHWTFTKNTLAGTMKIYRNGSLWHSGTGFKREISLDKMNMLSGIDNNLSYFGRVCQFSIWNKELDSSSIKDWMYNSGDKNHPFYSSLNYFFPLNDNVQNKLNDLSNNPINIRTSTFLSWIHDQGRYAINNMASLNQKISVGFIQGTVNNLVVDDIVYGEENPMPGILVKEYEIIDGNVFVKSTYKVYPAGEFLIYNENGEFVDSKIIQHDGIFVKENLSYQRFTPAKFELLSLVTPYGNGLDLGKEGKNFVFDVTDYAPVLRGNKRLSVELGGENQEELNIKFQYIKGKPARAVHDIQNVYTFQRQWFPDILNGNVFEPRKIQLGNESKYFKLRTTITGHEQNGEFVNRSHFIKVDGSKGSKKHDFNVWKECANNPIYPQGGTWIFDRAGWCPGAASDSYFHDITELTTPGSEVTIDYGLNGINLASANYLVSCQLVSYGDYNYNLDAGIENIIRPNSTRVEYERFNPSCSRPEIQVKNLGRNNITSLLIQYGMSNGIQLQYTWTGILSSQNSVQIELPVSNMQMWDGAQPIDNEFVVRILKTNNIDDENVRNNSFRTKFNFVRSFDFDPVFEIRTNSVAGDNSYRIKDANGTILIEKKNLNANTTTQENLVFPNGCYRIEIDDRANDGLSFWYYPNFGSGSSGIKRKQNTVFVPVQNFRADFGAGFQYDFIINKPNAVDDLKNSFTWNISPNPVNDEMSIEIQGLIEQTLKVQLIGIDGKIYFEKNIYPHQNSMREKIKLPEIASGIYNVQIISSERRVSKKIFVE